MPKITLYANFIQEFYYICTQRIYVMTKKATIEPVEQSEVASLYTIFF